MSKFFNKNGLLRTLVNNSYKAIDEGYYDAEKYHLYNHCAISFRKHILSCTHVPIISEIKFSSPSRGTIVNPNDIDLVHLAEGLVRSGVVGLSILTQPYMFKGSIDHLAKVRKAVSVPILMKDIIVSDVQIDAAKRIGADCILLIKTIFDDGMTEGSMEKFMQYAQDKDLYVLVEVHKESEFKEVMDSIKEPFLIGINNRNLNSLNVDLDVTKRLLQTYHKGNKIIISESGISNSDQIRSLRSLGVDAFLVGTSVMESKDQISKVEELCHAE
ncbi:MAG: indole-3-glycerol-phosphate synthase [Thermoproteota archaeon]|nr:indole-3-glycerol-phosphate synthase [Thermoproteota archaeon]